jgi:hypothetical protein
MIILQRRCDIAAQLGLQIESLICNLYAIYNEGSYESWHASQPHPKPPCWAR